MHLNLETALVNVCLLIILTVPHEFAHAWTAVRLGDDTPEREGRLTLYPPAHIDLLGTIILP
ncbi:MAG: site-2 protease family protein, partial [Bryobacterales bacterium]|nr:site-2 protease family protein [Bryobacterales bacterium]